MFSKDKFQHIIVAAVGALVFSTASVGAAVGPVQLQVAGYQPLAPTAAQA